MDRSQIRRRGVIAALAGLAFAATTVAASSSGIQQTGQWALRGTHAQIIGKLSATALPNGTELDIAQYRRNSRMLISAYDLDQTQYMHLIIVRGDFREFMHLHPVLSAGHFRTLIALSANQRYYAFADSRPAGIGQQVVRFTLHAGEPAPVQATKVAASLPEVAAGPYVVRLTGTIVPMGRSFTLGVTIARNGRLANDLQPYLAAPAHATLISTSDLTYIHVHPSAAGHAMEMSGMTMPSMKASAHVDPRMQLELPPLTRRGAYKMWLQFRGGGALYVAPFTLVAR